MTTNRFVSTLWAISLATFAVFAAALWQGTVVERHIADLAGRGVRSSSDIAEIALEGSKLRRFEKEYLLHVDDARRRATYYAEWKEAFDEARKQIAESAGRGESEWTRPELAMLAEWSAALAEYGQGFAALAADVDRGAVRGTAAANQQLDAAKKRIAVVLDGSEKLEIEKYMQLNAQSDALAAVVRMLRWTHVAFGLVGAGLVALLLTVRRRARG
jgi:hypothetical protein